MPTYWMNFPGAPRALRFKTEGEAVQAAREEFGYEGDLVPLKSHPVCSNCPLRGHCDNSRWNSLRHGDRPSEQAGITLVHVCRTCMTPSMTTYRGDGERRAVPPGCPRLDAVHGSAQNCDYCQQRLTEIQKSHPRYQEFLAEARKMTAAIMSQDLDALAESSRNIMTKMIPESRQSAFRIVATIMRDLDADPQAAMRWGKLTEPARHYIMFEWLGWMDLLMSRHDEPEQVLGDFLYILTDSSAIPWGLIPENRRRTLLREWEGVILREMKPDTEIEA